MTALVLVAAALVIATKVLDCATTFRAVSPGGAAETNPIGRWLMQRLGVAGAVTLVFAVSAGTTAALAAVALASGSAVVQWGYVGLACLVAVVQAAVAHTNWSGRWNFVTRRVLTWHGTIAATWLDGVFAHEPGHGVEWHEHAEITDADVQRLVQRIGSRVAKVLRRAGSGGRRTMPRTLVPIPIPLVGCAACVSVLGPLSEATPTRAVGSAARRRPGRDRADGPDFRPCVHCGPRPCPRCPCHARPAPAPAVTAVPSAARPD